VILYLHKSLNIKRDLSGLPSVIRFDGLFAAEDNWAAMEAKYVFSKFRIFYCTNHDQGSVLSIPESFFRATCLTILLLHT